MDGGPNPYNYLVVTFHATVYVVLLMENSGRGTIWVGWVKEITSDGNIKFELSLRCSNEDVK